MTRTSDTRSTTRRFAAVIVALCVAGAMSACGDDGSSAAAPSSSAPAAETETDGTTVPTTTPPPTAPGVPEVTLVDAIAPEDGFDNPSFVSIDESLDRLYVTDSENGRVVAIAPDGSDAVEILGDGSRFDFDENGSIGSADVAADGSLYVAESGRSRVLHVSLEGEVLGVLENPNGWGRLFTASIGPADDLVYTVDDEAGEVVVLDGAGGPVDRLGGAGDAPGELRDPGSVEVLADGTIWVADAGNGRVSHLAADGRPLQVIGPFEAGEDGYVEYPNDVAVDGRGRIWVADFIGGGVVAYRPDGTPIGRFGQSELTEPTSLTFDRTGRLFVTDWDADQVVVFTVTR